ncbi:MAG: ACP S-malonyltransferase [Pseudomonadota bacterium]
MTLAFVFPGQGSQSVGMQADIAAGHPIVEQTYAEANDILGIDLWALVQNGPESDLGVTTVTQPAMLCAGVAAFRVWSEAGGAPPSQLAGHSLGEYSALVAGGAMSFADAVRVVKRRSELMQDAVPVGVGAMAALLGLGDDKVIDVCAQAKGDDVCDAVNFNSPGQVVIAGHKAAVDRAIELAKEAGARRALPLPVSVPAHSALMREAGEALSVALGDADIRTPETTVISASDARPYGDGDDIRERLSRQVYSAVRWTETIAALSQQGANRILECGPGKVLAGLLRRIDRNIDAGALHDASSIQAALGSD